MVFMIENSLLWLCLAQHGRMYIFCEFSDTNLGLRKEEKGEKEMEKVLINHILLTWFGFHLVKAKIRIVKPNNERGKIIKNAEFFLIFVFAWLLSTLWSYVL